MTVIQSASAEFFESYNDRAILWDDPLLQIYRKNQLLGNSEWSKMVQTAYSNIKQFVDHNRSANDDSLSYAGQLMTVLIEKLNLLDDLDEVYSQRDMTGLQQLADRFPAFNTTLNHFLTLFRRYHYARYNPQGFEIFQVRIAGQKERFNELKLRLEELISNRITSIPELEQKASYPEVKSAYHMLVTASYFV